MASDDASAASGTAPDASDAASAAQAWPVRGRFDFLRKGAAVLVVLTSVTIGMIGLGLVVDQGRLWAIALLAATPLGIWGATRITPEGGTSGYCDQNI